MTPREKIKIIADVPLVITLEDCNGRECQSAYTGLEYRYHVERQGRPATLYLPMDGVSALRRAAPQQGDEVELLKTSQGTWTVRVLSDAQPLPPEMLLPQRQPEEASHSLMHAPAPPTPARLAQPRVQVHPLEALMTRCLEVGYFANQAAYQNLRLQGVEIDPPTWEDVRATGISFFIDRRRNGATVR